MKRIILAIAALFAASVVMAQAPAAPKPITAVSKNSADVPGTICDVVYTSEGETIDGHDIANTYIAIFAQPIADVLDDHKLGLRVLNAASKEQDKGGPYVVEFSEYRACDGAAAVKITDGSVLIKGMTLEGANRVARLALNAASEITARYEFRAKHGKKTGWDHSKARKVKRDDLARKIKD